MNHITRQMNFSALYANQRVQGTRVINEILQPKSTPASGAVVVNNYPAIAR